MDCGVCLQESANEYLLNDEDARIKGYIYIISGWMNYEAVLVYNCKKRTVLLENIS